MNRTTCDFCGAPATVWHGNATWSAHCSSDACWQRHRWDTWEPRLIPWMDPTPMQCAWGWLMSWLFAPICRLTPARWLLLHGGLRERWAMWVYGGAYFWCERSEGRV